VMRTTAFILLITVSFLSGAAPVEAVVAGPGNISAELLSNLQAPNFLPPLQTLNIVGPAEIVNDLPAFLIEQIPPDIVPIEPAEAVGRNVPGATGGLTHPACVAETARRAAEEQPPPMGDFPCIVPTSNASGIVDGVCFVNECRGVASTGLDGLLSALGGISSLGSIVSSVLENLLSPAPSSPSDGSPNTTAPQTPSTPPPTSLLITNTPLTPLDMSKLFNDSAIIINNLLFALNPQAERTP